MSRRRIVRPDISGARRKSPRTLRPPLAGRLFALAFALAPVLVAAIPAAATRRLTAAVGGGRTGAAGGRRGRVHRRRQREAGEQQRTGPAVQLERRGEQIRPG